MSDDIKLEELRRQIVASLFVESRPPVVSTDTWHKRWFRVIHDKPEASIKLEWHKIEIFNQIGRHGRKS